MPELPEVETVCRGLKPVLEGKFFSRIQVRRPTLRIEIPENFAQIFEHTVVRQVSRRAKYIVIHTDNDHVILMHLGMSGRVVIKPSFSNSFAKHDHVVFHTNEGKELIFHDPRRFGLITHCHENELANHKLIKQLGVEPLSDEFTPDYLASRLATKKVAIKQALMDAHLVVGVGNIYACESLFMAGISPFRPSYEVTQKELNALVPAIKDVLQRAIDKGGSSLRDYVQASGEMGYFQHNFAVYGKEGQPCITCGSTVERVKQSGRSTFYCRKCQP